MYAIIRVRGAVGTNPNAIKTLELLNLKRVNNLSVWNETPDKYKMFKKVEAYSTFGKIDDATLKELLEKKGESLEGNFDAKKALADLKAGKTPKQANVRNCFRLSPPRKGYERGGTKKLYVHGGALGERNEKISDIIKRML